MSPRAAKDISRDIDAIAEYASLTARKAWLEKSTYFAAPKIAEAADKLKALAEEMKQCRE